MFKIISVGWDTQGLFKQTLESIEMQDYKDFQVHVVHDLSSPDQQEAVNDWLMERRSSGDDRWTWTLPPERRYPVRNQYEGIRVMQPEDDDIIVFLDLDGDRLAHPRVLSRLAEIYEQQKPLLTYGGYVSVPPSETTPPYLRYPAGVSVRDYTRNVSTRFNHIRTMKWDVLKRVPDNYFKWPDGRWFIRGADYAVMIPCLELVGERYVCVQETLMYYNTAQPHPEYTMSIEEEDGTTNPYILSLPPLEQMP